MFFVIRIGWFQILYKIEVNFILIFSDVNNKFDKKGLQMVNNECG